MLTSRRCGIMPSILNDVLIHGQDSAALEAAHTLVRTLTSEERYSKAIGSMDALNEELEDLGFPGLWNASFHQPLRNKKECFQLTEKLIEVRLLSLYRPPSFQICLLTCALQLIVI